ncbi:MAG: dihydrofolate reductase [Anaerolineae bacterium]|nr:dihydrofolate reductase [Anaerolineae bacterium]
MRKVIYSLIVSLDGFIETPNRSLDWHSIDEEIHSFVNAQVREMGAFLYGRRLYEVMASFWPTADTDPAAPAYEVEFARIWRDKPKIVFSKTLEKVEWNSRLVRDNIGQEVTRLKAQPGKDMGLGGANIASTFMRLGLIDEYRLYVHPVILGAGTPFFPALDKRINLRLVETHTFGSGVVYLRYQRADEGQ